MSAIFRTPEYAAIKEFYGDKRAERSKVLLINHIHEGLKILEAIGANESAMRAYCLHPLFQNDAELKSVGLQFATRPGISSYVILLVMEYRSKANAWLSDKVKDRSLLNSDNKVVREDYDIEGAPDAGPIKEVVHMLIADKVQNCKDFEIHHKGKHERSKQLEIYFAMWMRKLGITKRKYSQLVELIKDCK